LFPTGETLKLYSEQDELLNNKKYNKTRQIIDSYLKKIDEKYKSNKINPNFSKKVLYK